MSEPTLQDRFHLIGIGGAGMSVVAELLASRGATVEGSDREESAVLEHLRSVGVRAFVGHEASHVDPSSVVVVSTAIREDNPELAVARERGQRVIHRSQALALAASGMRFVGVAGAHGKTTTSGMLAIGLSACGLDPSVAVGGVLLLILVLSGVWASKRDDEIGMALVSGVTRGRLGWQFMLEVFIVTLPFYVIGLVGGAFAANPIGSALASGHATPVTSGLIWTMVWYGLGSILILAILAALRLAFFSANKLFAADGDWGTVSETNKTTTTTDDAEAQA